MSLFWDPNRPIATCISKSCIGCTIQEKVHCHFQSRDLIQFYFIVAPSFLLGGAGIYHINAWLLGIWIILLLGYFGFLEIRVMCAHCPHYAEPGGHLRCWANYGAPKIWKYRPGPMSFTEKFLFLGGIVVVWGYPLVFLVMGTEWFLLIVYLVSVAGFFMTVSMVLCSQCMNFACPLNRVDDPVRKAFFRSNPEVEKGWAVKEGD